MPVRVSDLVQSCPDQDACDGNREKNYGEQETVHLRGDDGGFLTPFADLRRFDDPEEAQGGCSEGEDDCCQNDCAREVAEVFHVLVYTRTLFSCRDYVRWIDAGHESP